MIGVGLLLGAGVVSGACSSDDRPAATSGGSTSSGGTSGGGSSGTSGSSGAPVDASSDEAAAPQCPALALGGSVVKATYVGGTPPDDTGGTLTPGTYDLTTLQVYLGTPEEGDPDSGPVGGATDSAQSTLVVTTTTLHVARVSTTLGVVTPLAVSLASAHADGVELVTDGICPTKDSRMTPFTAAGSTLTLHTTQTRREVYTRRP
jgi:hypothetical protein